MRVDDLRALSLFDGLTDDQLAELVDGGTEVRIEPGVDLFREGEHADFWWVLVDGAIDLVRHVGREDTVVARMDVPGRWAGGFRAWDEQGVYLATGRGVTAGGCSGCRPKCCGSGPTPGSRSADTSSRGSTAPHAPSSRRHGSASPWSPSALSPPASRTRSTTRRRPPPGRSTRLEAACQTLLSSLGRLAHDDISAAQFAALDALRREIEPLAADPDPLARADREQALSLVARPATASSASGSSRRRSPPPESTSPGASGPRPCWQGSALEPGLEWVASTFSVATLLSEVKESTRRISELVAAVRSYSQMDRASMQHIDVTDGLESTLVMLGHKLRDGVTVVREYGADVPRIEAYAGELNQVWTNLIDNAVDAMDGAGTLRVATRVDGDDVVVEIGDTGPGHAARGGGPRVRGLLHDQGRRQRHRPRPRHRPAHRRRAPRRHDHHRLPAGRNGAAGPHPRPAARALGRTVDRLACGIDRAGIAALSAA